MHCSKILKSRITSGNDIVISTEMLLVESEKLEKDLRISLADPETVQIPPDMQRDLSNFKLAQNQTELSQQITQLYQMLEDQGHLITQLVEATEGLKARKHTKGEGSTDR